MAKAKNRETPTYLGSVCKRGHVGLRYVSGACIQCHSESTKASKRTSEELKKMKVVSRAWYLRNKKRRAEEQKSKRLSDIPSYKAEQRKSYQKHREKRLAQCREYYKNNKGKAFAKVANRRAKKFGAGGTHNEKDIKRIFDRQRGRCAACRKKLSKYHRDHILPLVLGGDNNAKNIQLLCPPCNLQKHAKHPVEFMQELGFLL